MSTLPPLLVIGAGSWGTALAIHIARNGRAVHLWGRDASALATMAKAACNQRYLPDAPFPEGLLAEPDLGKALKGCQDVLMVVPSHSFRDNLSALRQQARAQAQKNLRIAWASKGFERGTGKFLHQVCEEVMGNVPKAVISGPTFAKELAAGLPAAIAVAADDDALAADWVTTLHGSGLRAYTTDDMLGVQLGGALKNIMAIAAGAADGLGFGANTRAALITRGTAESMRFGLALGAQPDTFMGLAGLGDLVLTCTDNQSRNRQMGLLLAQGLAVDEAIDKIGQVVEGVKAAREVQALATDLGVEMPITEQVCAVLEGHCTPLQAVHDLLGRQPRPENE